MAEQVFKIPLTNRPQQFEIELSGRSLLMTSKWNGQQSAWEISIADSITNEPLVVCLPLVAGIDLLKQSEHIGIHGKLVCYTDGDQFAPPTLGNLGQEAALYYLVDA